MMLIIMVMVEKFRMDMGWTGEDDGNNIIFDDDGRIIGAQLYNTGGDLMGN